MVAIRTLISRQAEDTYVCKYKSRRSIPVTDRSINETKQAHVQVTQLYVLTSNRNGSVFNYEIKLFDILIKTFCKVDF